MDMSARDCNRDGAALRFVAEKLSKQTSEVKILMIICDGQPNDDGYSGSAAEADLRGIKMEYARKGVKIYAAAIGEDRPRIERIYGDGYLDITNLQELPVMLTNLIVRMIPALIPLSITSCADIKSMCHFARRAGSMISSSALQSKMASVSISDICVPKVRSALKKSLIVCTS